VIYQRGTRDEVPAHDLRQPGEVVQHPGRDCKQEYSTGQLRRGRPSGRLPRLPLAIVANETPVK
jgi:hypothetical protein